MAGAGGRNGLVECHSRARRRILNAGRLRSAGRRFPNVQARATNSHGASGPAAGAAAATAVAAGTEGAIARHARVRDHSARRRARARTDEVRNADAGGAGRDGEERSPR